MVAIESDRGRLNSIFLLLLFCDIVFPRRSIESDRGKMNNTFLLLLFCDI